MQWRNAVASMALLTVFATESLRRKGSLAPNISPRRQPGKRKPRPVSRTLIFDPNSKKVEFLNPKGTPAFSINYDAIHAMQYEKTSQPRYVAAALISPAFLLTRSPDYVNKPYSNSNS